MFHRIFFLGVGGEVHGLGFLPFLESGFQGLNSAMGRKL